MQFHLYHNRSILKFSRIPSSFTVVAGLHRQSDLTGAQTVATSSYNMVILFVKVIATLEL